ncbi:hypothetical protein [Dyadobacter tibetensis]|uniref:hypothetical protein n=1 Tax=Dyadobacter tibetensis TaxID=1211851 RepID=UPI00046FF279|nr:hypothetical protein [Dyadobacter tibetensis]
MRIFYNTMTSLSIPSLRSLAILLLSSLLWGCQSQTREETEMTADSIALTDPVQNELNSDQSVLLSEILSDEAEGKLRGISFGDPVSKVKATEAYDIFEELPDHLGYTHETEQLETIDVQYHLTKEGKVNKIEIDVYLNSQQAATQLLESGKKYFTEKAGPTTSTGPVYSWNAPAMKIQMEDVSKGKDFGLKFLFHPNGKQALASK